MSAWSFTVEALLVMVMLVSGMAKLASPGAFRPTLEMIPWLPEWAIPILVHGLPIAEIVAAVLLFSPWAVGGLIVVLALLTAFTVPVVWAIAQDQRIRCACFGSLSEARFGFSSLVRLVALAGAAAVPLVTGRARPLAGISREPALLLSFLAAGSLWLAATIWAAVIPIAKNRFNALAWLNLPQKSAAGRDRDGLHPGLRFPFSLLWDRLGITEVERHVGLVAVLVASPSCGTCRPLLEAIPGLAEKHPDIQVILLLLGEEDHVAWAIRKFKLNVPVLAYTADLQKAIDTKRVPTLYVVGRDRRIQLKTTPHTADEFEAAL